LAAGDVLVGYKVSPLNERNKADIFKLAAAVIAHNHSRFIWTSRLLALIFDSRVGCVLFTGRKNLAFDSFCEQSVCPNRISSERDIVTCDVHWAFYSTF
jgi:hypothetical protein